MDVVFPLGFSWPTALYLSLYVVTLVVHVVFMNYVLAGTAFLVVASVDREQLAPSDGQLTSASVLRDWMPFGLSAAITAGVAPLLFIQILYQEAFYTANLLGFHRWMSILPVLIVGFYLLYLFKSPRLPGRPAAVRVAVILGAFACFAFTGYSWTENHLLSRRAEVWPAVYAAGGLVYWEAELLPRLALWMAGAVPNLALLVGWQLWFLQRRAGATLGAAEVRRVCHLAIGGLLASAACGLAYYVYLSPNLRSQVTGDMARAYLVAALVGWLAQLDVWVRLRRRSAFTVWGLARASLGAGISVLGMTVVREAVRLSSMDIAALLPHHQRAAEVGGLSVFVVFALLNVLLIGACILIVRRGQRTSTAV